MAVGTTATTRSLQETPTWALATVCFVFIAISIVLEHSIHLLSNWLKKHQKTALMDAVEKLKSELMLLGFISLLLAVTQRSISKICIPTKVADTMLPCHKLPLSKSGKVEVYEHLKTETVRKLFSIDGIYENRPWQPHRLLATDTSYATDHCSSKGMVSLVAQTGIHQLHIFIFVLAVMQIAYSALTMVLGRAKMKRWKHWEKETQTTEYQIATDPNRFRITRQTTFGRRHMSSFTDTTVHLWIKCFFRQFFNSVAKVDYLTLRHGFISAHLSTNKAFNFQKYIKRCLEDDFKAVVGISPIMWFIVVVFLLVDVHGWHVYVWVSFFSLAMLLVLGTKLEVIVARMALQLRDQNSVIKGAPVVEPNDKLFWFGHPKFVLTLLHFTLFMNAFELAFFIWVTLQFGLKSCYHERIEIIITRVVLAVAVQVICSYITLPLYALVTQMGSQFKTAVLEEQTLKFIKRWHAGVRKKQMKLKESSQSNHSSSSGVRDTRKTSPAEIPSSLSQDPENFSFPTRGEITEEHPEIIIEEPSPASVQYSTGQLELPVMRKGHI